MIPGGHVCAVNSDLRGRRDDTKYSSDTHVRVFSTCALCKFSGCLGAVRWNIYIHVYIYIYKDGVRSAVQWGEHAQALYRHVERKSLGLTGFRVPSCRLCTTKLA